MGNCNVIISGSRCRGLESKNSDIDIVVEYKGSEHEDTLFNAFNEDGLTVGGVKVDINPITEGTESYQDTTIDIVSGKIADLEVLEYVPDISDDPKAIEIRKKGSRSDHPLILKFPTVWQGIS